MTIKEFRIFIVYLTIVSFIVLGLYLDRTSSESITDKVQAICSFLSLGVSLVAIIYVYKTYQKQSEDGKDNNRNTEFNRALDIIYNQLEYTNRRFEKKVHVLYIGNGDYDSKIKYYPDLYEDLFNVMNTPEHVLNWNRSFNDIQFRRNLVKLLKFLSTELALYDRYISRSIFSEDEKKDLAMSVATNIADDLIPNFRTLYHYYESFRNTKSYAALREKNDGLINDIEHHLPLVMGCLQEEHTLYYN